MFTLSDFEAIKLLILNQLALFCLCIIWCYWLLNLKNKPRITCCCADHRPVLHSQSLWSWYKHEQGIRYNKMGTYFIRKEVMKFCHFNFTTECYMILLSLAMTDMHTWYCHAKYDRDMILCLLLAVIFVLKKITHLTPLTFLKWLCQFWIYIYIASLYVPTILKR